MIDDKYLNTENIERSGDGVEYHPLVPFLPRNAKVLFLGSFPPQRKRWCMNFYYPNFINDHWRIEGEVFFGNRQHFVVDGDKAASKKVKAFDIGKIVRFCEQQGIAFFDTATAVRRLKDNASDEHLEVVEPTDIRRLIGQLPHVEVIVTTGQKATETLCRYFGLDEVPKVGYLVAIPETRNQDGQQVRLYRLPSSSRAYPLAFDKKVAAYRKMFDEVMRPVLDFYDLGRGVTAFTTTRLGGSQSRGQVFDVNTFNQTTCPYDCYASFNINRYCGDTDEHIRGNRTLLCQRLGIIDDHLLMPHQVHQTRIAQVDERLMTLSEKGREEALEGCDALMTDLYGVCIGVSTADCIPVLLYDEAHHAVCAVHAGWRGTVARICQQAVEAMSSAYGSRPEQLRAQIGPGISLDSFEVGQEVYDAFCTAGFDMTAISRKEEKWHIDLPECNRLQLIAAGLPVESITVSTVCTYRQPDRYFSARRLGIRSGRLFTGIIMKKG